MEKFQATKFEEDGIELANSSDLEKLYQIIEKEENFIVNWTEGGVKRSKVIIGTNLMSKVKNGNLELSAQEPNKKESKDER